MMLIGSGALAVIPRRVAADVTAVLPLIMLLLPFPSSRAKLSMIWHRRLDNDPAQRWLTGTLRAAVNRNGDSGRRPNNGPAMAAVAPPRCADIDRMKRRRKDRTRFALSLSISASPSLRIWRST
jgi:hypothetical protein